MPKQFQNAYEGHPLPNGDHPAVDIAQGPSRGGKWSPREVKAAKILVLMSSGVIEQRRAQREMARPEPNQARPITGSATVETAAGAAAHDEAAGEEEVAPGDSTEDEPEVSQQDAPQQDQSPVQGQGQGQEQQEPRESRRPGEDDSHIDGSASSVLTNSGSRRPPPSSRPQLKRKRESDGVKKEGDEEDGKGAETKKSPKRKRRTPKDGNEVKFKCEQCGKDFARKDHLTRHVEDKHGVEMPSGVRGVKKYACKKCAAKILRMDNFKSHMRTQHAGVEIPPKPKFEWVSKEGVILHEEPKTLSTGGRARMARPDQAELTSGSSGPTGPRLAGFQAINN